MCELDLSIYERFEKNPYILPDGFQFDEEEGMTNGNVSFNREEENCESSYRAELII